MQKSERRCFTFVRDAGTAPEDRKMVGHAAVFNEVTDIGGWFREQILPGAFKDSIATDDVRALFNHDPNYVLGRNTAGTLTLAEDEKGLRTTINPPDTQYARDLAVSMERGDITQMSFAFQVLEEEWTRGEKADLDLRSITKVRLFDVSPVTFPAYEGTDVALRSHAQWTESQRPAPPDSTPDDAVPYSLRYRQSLILREMEP